ncbi:hypothetical protein K402DRAFT_179859 [Aulographum hederae CBS 113979]|uniref:Transmembrane protein n=1 Tax=Aulographum hederae CBS 113979 TaxID=1176131 RepID=A0A6G1GR40_9PEZI|nr:hypothetical protein K402DRAFT_179859 [Aulographum hederae CBS 113979]
MEMEIGAVTCLSFPPSLFPLFPVASYWCVRVLSTLIHSSLLGISIYITRPLSPSWIHLIVSVLLSFVFVFVFFFRGRGRGWDGMGGVRGMGGGFLYPTISPLCDSSFILDVHVHVHFRVLL